MKLYYDKTRSADERAAALVDEMTIEEAASQLRYNSPAIPRLGVPEYTWWNEALHGVARAGTATMFPQAIALAAMFDTEMMDKVAETISIEGRAKYRAASEHGDRDAYKGLTFWSPNINIFRDPRWGRGHETYGEDPYLTAEIGKAYVHGLQGEGPVMRAAACAKHFAVHSGPEQLRHEFNACPSKHDMEDTYLPAFEALVRDAHVEGIMGAYNRVWGEPCCASDVLQQYLTDWGFSGYFCSDCMAIIDFHENHHITANAVESAALALKHNCDVNCGCAYMNVLAALEEGLITEEDIRRACRHLMRTRIRLGMFDDSTPYDDIPYSVISCKEHKALAERCAENSMVLLSNNGILPLDETKYKTIAVVGPNADSRNALEGNYNGTPDRYITFLEGIEDRFSGRVLYAEGCHLCNPHPDVMSGAYERISEALACAENADLVIACVGLDAFLEGEEGDPSNIFGAGDKDDVRLPISQRTLLEKLKATGKPLIIVCAAGSSINTEIPCDALLHAWYPGQNGGKALASILFGDVSPSGKLPVTFYESAEKLPDFTDYSMKNRTYRYTRDNILYPFGYGLTYGHVTVTKLTYEDGYAYVSAKNDGAETSDVIELYLSDDSAEATPYPSLCGFARIHLKNGEETSVKIPVSERAFTSVDENGVRAVRGNVYTLYAGTHQPDTLSASLSGTDCLSLVIPAPRD